MARGRLVIVGFGRIGKEYLSLFSPAFDVTVVSSREVSKDVRTRGGKVSTSLAQALAGAEFVALTVPLSALSETVSKLNPLVSQTVVAFDACSAQVEARRVMANLACSSFGLHGWNEATTVVCGDAPTLIVEHLEKRGLQVLQMTPEEHDRRNAVIGGAQFIALGMREAWGSDARGALAGSPLGRKLLACVEHVESNSPATYVETQVANHFTVTERRRIIDHFVGYDQRLASQKPITPPSIDEV
jgi:prephenate dehydrogenase